MMSFIPLRMTDEEHPIYQQEETQEVMKSFERRGWSNALRSLHFLVAQSGNRMRKNNMRKQYAAEHPIRVAIALLTNDIGGEEAVQIALLHDIREDFRRYITKQIVQDLFGWIVADGIETLTRKKGQTAEEYAQGIENHVQSARLMCIKLFDRLDNYKDAIISLSIESLKEYVHETQTIILRFPDKLKGYHKDEKPDFILTILRMKNDLQCFVDQTKKYLEDMRSPECVCDPV